jgi:hypothetical protein
VVFIISNLWNDGGTNLLRIELFDQCVSQWIFDCASWKRVGVMAVDQKLSQFSHGPDSREPQPLPARLSVDVTAKSVV